MSLIAEPRINNSNNNALNSILNSNNNSNGSNSNNNGMEPLPDVKMFILQLEELAKQCNERLTVDKDDRFRYLYVFVQQ